ncbi:MAG TPA: glycosyltransferase, partial [Candidatus Hodarchaeales archaeon]|nr:glycosyltransferase [Candidatus Hodarchaeales archaeon]
MKLHTVVVTYNRLELTKQTIGSYLETVTVPFTLVVVDNRSDEDLRQWLLNQFDYGIYLLNENHYPGFACNRGWERAPKDAIFLHRSDNDFRFLPGWCEETQRMFEANSKLGQLGLRTDEEELFVAQNTGGNCVIRRELWDQGLRWDETPWPKYPPGWSEDSFFSPAVLNMGYEWDRVERPCIESLASGDWRDPYYQES